MYFFEVYILQVSIQCQSCTCLDERGSGQSVTINTS